MRPTSRVLLIAPLALLLVAAGPVHADQAVTAVQEHPLAAGKLSLKDGGAGSRSVVFHARWQAAATMGNPIYDGSTLRVSGQGPNDGDSGLIQLDPSRWTRLGKG